MSVFVSRPMNIVTFLRKNADLPKRVVGFPRERYTFRNKIMEIVQDLDETRYNKNNSKSWISSQILRVKLNFFIFLSFFIIFLHSFMFFHFLSFSCIFFHFYHFPSFSFIFYHFLSFSFIFFFFVGCSKSDFFWASISLRFLLTVLM